MLRKGLLWSTKGNAIARPKAEHPSLGPTGPCLARTRRGWQRCRAETPVSVDKKATADRDALFQGLAQACEEVRTAPESYKQELSANVMTAMRSLSDAGLVAKWGGAATESVRRRSVFNGDLKLMGIKEPEKIARPTVRNDAAFIVAVVGGTSVVAVLAGQLPGDWGFFVPYLVGSISLVVLAVGSTNPGLLQFFIDGFSRVFPDYRERLLRHEAAHFLTGYLLGVPITEYSLDIGRQHTDFAEAKLQRRIIEGGLEDSDVDVLAVISMAGVAAEAGVFDDIVGQTADLLDLQRILNNSRRRLSAAEQQNVTRWAVWQAASLLRTYKKEYEALMEAMKSGLPVTDCVRAVEGV